VATPRPNELVPSGGTWSGLLFDNPTINLAPGLTWTFTFEFEEVSRDFGDSAVSFTVDWVPLPGASWTAMAGQSVTCDVFGEPVETSAYCFEHHRYDAVRLRVLEQDGTRLHVVARASGDVDAMGVQSWNVDAWLEFEGIRVQLSDADTVEAATARLDELTDTAGLTARATGHNFLFRSR
jgi:hypothetical protein